MAWSYPVSSEIEPSKPVDISQFAQDILIDEPVKLEKARTQQIQDFDVVWEPIRGSSQELAITCPAHHILYCGARGPGKTITQLMRFRARVGIGYGSYWRGIIFDREFKNLGDLVAQGNRFFPKLDEGVVWHKSATDFMWVWPTGEQLLLRHVKKLEDYDGFHGWEIPFIGWNELTKNPTSELYDKFMSINRSSFSPEKHTPKRKQGNRFVCDTENEKPLPPIPLEVFSTFIFKRRHQPCRIFISNKHSFTKINPITHISLDLVFGFQFI